MSCECGCGRAVEVVVDNEQPGQPYRLCRPCYGRLDARSLRPLEWFNLATIHSPWKYSLHDDLYDEGGQAMQPNGEVEYEDGLMVAPTLGESARTLPKLLTFIYTQHFLTPEMSSAMRRFDPLSLLFDLESSLQIRTPNPNNIDTACEIAAEVLGSVARDFVRIQMRSADADSFGF